MTDNSCKLCSDAISNCGICERSKKECIEGRDTYTTRSTMDFPKETNYVALLFVEKYTYCLKSIFEESNRRYYI